MEQQGKRVNRKGFTLVEVMIVVTLIGLLATLALPSIKKARQHSYASSLANNYRTYAAAFEIYATENGEWPPDVGRGTIPPGMEGHLPRFKDTIGQDGKWDWDYKVAGVTAGVTLRSSKMDPAIFVKIDQILDDGNTSKGRMRSTSSGLTYILEP